MRAGPTPRAFVNGAVAAVAMGARLLTLPDLFAVDANAFALETATSIARLLAAGKRGEPLP